MKMKESMKAVGFLLSIKGIGMKTIERLLLDRFKSLLNQRVPLYKVVLFGSRARGDAEPDSDLDVLVIVEGTDRSPYRQQISECAWEAGFEHGIVLVPVVFSRHDWENGPEHFSPLAQIVEKEGVVV